MKNLKCSHCRQHWPKNASCLIHVRWLPMNPLVLIFFFLFCFLLLDIMSPDANRGVHSIRNMAVVPINYFSGNNFIIFLNSCLPWSTNMTAYISSIHLIPWSIDSYHIRDVHILRKHRFFIRSSDNTKQPCIKK